MNQLETTQPETAHAFATVLWERHGTLAYATAAICAEAAIETQDPAQRAFWRNVIDVLDMRSADIEGRQ